MLRLSILENGILRVEVIEITPEGEFPRFSSTPYSTLDTKPITACNLMTSSSSVTIEGGWLTHHLEVAKQPASVAYSVSRLGVEGVTPVLTITDIWMEHCAYKKEFMKERKDAPLSACFHGKESVIPRGPTGIGLKVVYGNKEGVNFYGLAERIKSLKLTDTKELGHPYRLYNEDHFIDTHPEQTIYGSVPILYAHTRGGGG